MEITQKTFARRKPDQLVYLELGSGNGGMLLSASEEGFRFRAVSPLRADGFVPFSFSFDGAQRLSGVGQIQWLEEDAKSGGIRFTDVSGEFRAALTAWLASSPGYSRSTRETTPAAATPLDTMEKIRRDLRAGVLQRDPQSSRSARWSAEREQKRDPSATSAPVVVAETPAVSTPAQRPEQEPEEETNLETGPMSGNSAFLRPVGETSAEASAVADTASAPAMSAVSALAAPVVADESEAANLTSTSAARPYIPPPDESFEAAWERARALASMQRAPSQMNRAFAGTLIGLALAVILAALAVNFRRDIGIFLIELGEKISGDRAASNAAANSLSPADSSAQSNPARPATPETAAHNGVPDKASAESLSSGAANAGTPPNAASDSGTIPASGSAPSTTKSDTVPAGKSDPAAAAKPNPKESAAAKSSAAAAVKPIEAPGPGETGSGQQEFVAARDMLRGSHRQKDLPKAVSLLWSGVRKGYVPAEVTLADLYMRGDGVQKSCTQAQVLLAAASKKGSPDARQMLEKLAEHGCR